jgi:hypothetical protein
MGDLLLLYGLIKRIIEIPFPMLLDICYITGVRELMTIINTVEEVTYDNHSYEGGTKTILGFIELALAT